MNLIGPVRIRGRQVGLIYGHSLVQPVLKCGVIRSFSDEEHLARFINKSL
jgi:hypothetical protein